MKLCELCNGVATIYCPSDSALLCWNCDSKVHAANFLVARHLRSIICSNCTLAFTTSTFSGYKCHYHNSLCNSCLEQVEYSSSDCISSTESSSSKHHNSSSSITYNNNKNQVSSSSKCNTSIIKRSSVDWKAEAILVNWGNKLGIKNRNVVEVACHAFGNTTKLNGVPYRVGLAASLWFSLRLWESKSEEQRLQLKRLEEICGVPSMLIIAAHSKLARIKIKINRHGLHLHQHHHHHRQQEGWAESF